MKTEIEIIDNFLFTAYNNGNYLNLTYSKNKYGLDDISFKRKNAVENIIEEYGKFEGNSFYLSESGKHLCNCGGYKKKIEDEELERKLKIISIKSIENTIAHNKMMFYVSVLSAVIAFISVCISIIVLL